MVSAADRQHQRRVKPAESPFPGVFEALERTEQLSFTADAFSTSVSVSVFAG